MKRIALKSVFGFFVSTVFLSISLDANEIKPFGKFEFGDSFSEVHEKICNMNNIKTVQFGYKLKEIKKSDFCTSKDKALEYMRKGLEFVNKVNTFDEIGYFNANDFTPIRLRTVNIKGIEFKVDILLFANSPENTIGSYLLTKNDTYKFGDYLVPMQVNTIRLYPVNESQYRNNRKAIYDLLKEKYQSLVTNVEQSDRYTMLNIMDKNNNQLVLDDSYIMYKSNMNEVYNNKYKEYLQNKTKANLSNDQSGDL